MMIGTSGRAAFAFGSSSSPLIPGMLMSDRIRMIVTSAASANALKRSGRRLGKVHGEATIAQVAPKLLAEQHFNVGLVVDHQNKQVHVLCPRCRYECSRARQNDLKLSIFARLGLDFNRPAMLLHDDIVADGEAKAGAFSGWLGGEERIEDLFLHLRRNPGAVVPNRDFHTVSEAACRDRKNRLIAIAIGLGFTLCRRIKAVQDQVQKYSRDVLRKHVGLASGRIK